MSCGEDQAGIYPAVPRAVAVGILLLLTDPECGRAQFGQRERCLRRLGLDLAADELASDALELFPHVQLAVFEVNLIPGQAEDFTSAQPKDEDQDEGREWPGCADT